MKRKKSQPDNLLAAAQAELQAQLEVLQARREELVKGGFDKDLANSAAALGRAITSLAGEMRQQEKHVQQLAARMSPDELDEVLEQFLRDLPVERLARFKSLVDELTSSGSVL
jgi:Skp family chaperone for outer membrane proteins